MEIIDSENPEILRENETVHLSGSDSSILDTDKSRENQDIESEITHPERLQKCFKKIINFRYAIHIILLFIFLCIYILGNLGCPLGQIEKQLAVTYEELLSELAKAVLLHGLIYFVISYITFFICTGTSFLNYAFFYIHDVSNHLSLSIVLIWYYQPIKNTISHISENIDHIAIFKLILGGILFFGGKKIFIRNISLSFNYGLHLERIRDCLIIEYFLNIIGVVGKNYRFPMKNLELHVPWLGAAFTGERVYRRINNVLFSDISIFEKDVAIKRLLLMEFQQMCKTDKGFQGDPFKEHKRFQRYTFSKAKKLSARLIKGGFITYGSLARFFNCQEIFNGYLEKLKMSEHTAVGPDALSAILYKHGKERYCLSQSLVQMNAALQRVSRTISIIAMIIFSGILISNISNIENPFSALFGTIFGTSFVLNSSVENAIGCVIFLFFIHPYDVGDRVFIHLDSKDENLVVTELNVFSTVFLRWDGVVVVVPNQILREKQIINIRRCGVMTESHRIQVDVNTPTEKIDKLRMELKAFVKSNQDHFTDFLMVNYESIENNNILHLRIVMQYRKNWQNYELFLERKSLFMGVLNMFLKNCAIDYKPLTQRIHLSQ